MPTVVKKVGSFFILGTYVTSIAIAVTIFGGTILKGAYDDNKDLIVIKEDTANIQTQMGELFKFHYDTQLQVKEHEVIINGCKEDIKECQKNVLDLNRRAQ